MKITPRQMATMRDIGTLTKLVKKLRNRVDKYPYPQGRKTEALFNAAGDELVWRLRSKSE